MKPNWKDAPSWASWLAQDEEGTWYWYENEPCNNDDGVWQTKGKFSNAGEGIGWKNSLEQKPSNTP